jgi:NTE family protein
MPTKSAPKSSAKSSPRSRAVAPRAGRASADVTPEAPILDLALQGGGSHGAFTWGVLDRLLEEPDLRFAGVSGTSAGALNAGVLATGMARGGASAAREALGAFWRDVASTGACFGSAVPASRWFDDMPGLFFPPASGHATGSGPTAGAASGWPFALPVTGFQAAQWPSAFPMPFAQKMAEWMWRWPAILSKFASPYQFNPLGVNPLRDVAERHVDVQAMRQGPLKLFITATSVHTGQAEVFKGERLSIDALLASACLPHLFQAVEIDGVPYWDGGYTGNPALWPLIYDTDAVDMMLVKINPLERRETPKTPMEIADRVSEITFNAGLTGELRAIAFVTRLMEDERLEPGRYKNLRLHMVHDEDQLAALGPQSKLDTGWDFLQALHAMGWQAAERWLVEHRRHLGVKSTLDIDKTFLTRRVKAPAA